MNKFTQFLTLNSLILSTSLLVSSPARAFDFSLESQSGNDYSYTVTLDSDDSIDVGDQLILTNLSGVTTASANSPYVLGGSNDSSADFSVGTATNGAATLTSVISLTSADSLDGLEYTAFYTDNGTPRVASGNITAVPFGVSPNLGIILLLGGYGLHQLKRKFG